MSVAITKVGSGSNGNTAATASVTLSAGIAVGERALFVVNSLPNQAVSSFTDAKGNTWSLLTNTGVINNNRNLIYESTISVALVATDVLSITFTTAIRFGTPRVYKVTGAKTSAPTITTAVGFANGVYWSGTDVTGPVNGGMAIVFAGQNGVVGSHTPLDGWTEIHEGATAQGCADITYPLNPGQAAVTPRGSLNGINNGSSVGLIFEDINTPTPPVARIGAEFQTADSSLTVDFSDQSTLYPTSWDWDYGDGTTHGTTQNPEHTYTQAGKYTVTLTATNAGGSDSESMDILVGSLQIAPPTEGQLWPRQRLKNS